MSEKTDRRVRKTRAQLRAGLATVMQKKSIKEITVKELVEEVDINRSTFYLHYADIYQMLESIENELMDEIQKTIQGHFPSHDAGGSSLEFAVELLSILYQNKELCMALMGPNGDMVFVGKIEKLVAETVLPDLFRQLSTDPHNMNYLYAFCLNGCVGLIKAWLSGGQQDSPEHMARLIHRVITRYLASNAPELY